MDSQNNSQTTIREESLPRGRWGAVLSKAQLDYCIENDISVAFDCAQIGWVLNENEFGDELVSSSDDKSGIILGLKSQFASALLELVESGKPDAESAARELSKKMVGELSEGNDSMFLDGCHYLLESEIAANFANKIDSKSDEFVFRPWTGDDVASYLDILGNKKVWEFLPEEYPEPFDEELASALIEAANLGSGHEVYAVEFNGEVIGQIRLLFDDHVPELKCAEVAYILGERFWGKGLMPRVLSEFTQKTFKDSSFDSIYAWILSDHGASIKCAENSGYYRDNAPNEAEVAKATGRPGFLRYLSFKNQVVD